MLDPMVYANELTRKMKLSSAEAWLVNTGWMGGPYGTGNRIDLPVTRKIINAILDESILKSEFQQIPVFRLSIPSHIEGIDDSILDPGKTWESPSKWRIAATDLGLKFINNFTKFSSSKESAILVDHGPVVE